MLINIILEYTLKYGIPHQILTNKNSQPEEKARKILAIECDAIGLLIVSYIDQALHSGNQCFNHQFYSQINLSHTSI